MERKNNQAASLFVVGVVALVAVVALVLNGSGSLEGAPVFEKTDDYQKTCADDDPENNFFTKGTVKFANRVYEDYCSGEFLVQHQCKTGTNVRPLRHYQCPNGCLEGACLR